MTPEFLQGLGVFAPNSLVFVYPLKAAAREAELNSPERLAAFEEKHHTP